MLYPKKSVTLIPDIYQDYINTSKSAFGNNLLYSYSTPNFTWKAGLKFTGVELKHITDDKLRVVALCLLGETDMKNQVKQEKYTIGLF